MNPQQQPADPHDDNTNVDIDPDTMLQAALQVAIGAGNPDSASDGVHWLAEKLEGFKRQREQDQV